MKSFLESLPDYNDCDGDLSFSCTLQYSKADTRSNNRPHNVTWGVRGAWSPASVTWCWSWWGSSSTWSPRSHWAPALSGQGPGSGSGCRHNNACIMSLLINVPCDKVFILGIWCQDADLKIKINIKIMSIWKLFYKNLKCLLQNIKNFLIGFAGFVRAFNWKISRSW